MSKHLVLDDDVHRQLVKRKTESGLKIRDIGNAVLRSILEKPLLTEIVGRRLAEAGLVSEEEYDAVLREATEEAVSSAPLASEVVRRTKRATLSTGSWELKELVCDAENGFQVVRAWAKDGRCRPFSSHRHASVEILVVLSGKLGVTIGNELCVIEAPGCFMIQPGMPHAVAPLDRETQILGILSPPDEGLHTERP